MNSRGSRVIYDVGTGYIVATVGEMWGSGDIPPHHEIQELAYVDLPFGRIPGGRRLVSIDTATGEPILEAPELTEEQKRIKELEEDVLLLQVENEVGGIL